MTKAKKNINPSRGCAEDHILEVAAEVFTKKGYAATRTRDIAEAAGFNVALIHYYYKNKDRLFELVATKALMEFRRIMDRVFTEELPLHHKIKIFVEEYTNFFKANPYLPLFIVTESEKNPDKIAAITHYKKTNVVMEKQLKELAQQGIIRPISIANFIENLVGLTVFPFLSKALVMREANLSHQDFEDMLEERKTIVPDMIINYLYINKPED